MLMYKIKIKQKIGRASLGVGKNSNLDKKAQRMNSIVQRLVLFLLISYLPYLIWKEQFDGIVVRGKGKLGGGKSDYPNITNFTLEAICLLLFGINSCVNPFVYAKTIPTFRKLARHYLRNP